MPLSQLALHLKRLSTVSEADPFLGMTFPFFRSQLQQVSAGSPFLAIGAVSDGDPVGLLLAERLSTNTAKLHSLFVHSAHRNLGIATALMRQMEEILLSEGVKSVQAVYTTGKDMTPALDRVFDRTGWSPPEPRTYLFHGTPDFAQHMLNTRWLRHGEMPQGFSLFPWAEISEEHRRQVEADLATGVLPFHLDPFFQPEKLEPACSLGLCYQERVVGWIVCHRGEAGLTRATSLYVQEKLPVSGLGLRLLAEALERYVQHQADTGTKGNCWGTPVNLPFARFLERRVIREIPGLKVSLSVERYRTLGTQESTTS